MAFNSSKYHANVNQPFFMEQAYRLICALASVCCNDESITARPCELRRK